MTRTTADGLPRISRNPGCQVQAAMIIGGEREPDFFRQVTGRPFEGEYGQRGSALRRAVKFEENLLLNDAGRLRQVLGPQFGFDPDAAWVRNLADEHPGSASEFKAMRLWKTRKILADLSRGDRVPDLVIQPQLRIVLGAGWDAFVTPPFIVLDHASGLYVVGNYKSFVSRDDVADPSDLDRVRRESATHVLALQSETARAGKPSDAEHAVMVFARAAGMSPAQPRVETLHAEVAAILRAVDTLQVTNEKVKRLRIDGDERLAMLVDDLDADYRDSCHAHCILADHCAGEHAGTARSLGDAAARALGGDTTAADLAGTLTLPEQLRTRRQSVVARHLADAAESMGITTDQLHRMLA